MALVLCAECGKEISDRALTCPNCGCPSASKENRSEKCTEAGISELALPEMIKYLSYVKQLEVYRYTLQNVIKKLQKKNDTLGFKRTYNEPQSEAAAEFKHGFLKGFIFSLIPLLIIAAFCGSNGSLFDAISCLFMIVTIVMVFFSSKLIVCVGIALGAAIVIGLFCGAVAAAAEKSKYNAAYKEYMRSLGNDKERVEREIQQKKDIEKQQMQLREEIQAIDKQLSELYGINIVHRNYRNMVAVVRILEYFDSGRCTHLTGHEGAYNRFEDEMLHEKIIGKLDVAISKLDQIRNTQYLLYEAILESAESANRMYAQSEKLLEANERIAENTEIAAYNAKIAATNSAISAYIDVFEL